MEIETIHNYLQINEKIATSVQPKKNQYNLINKYKYNSIINIASSSEESLPDESFIVTNLGMNYFQIPVLFNSPQINQLVLFCEFLDMCLQQRHEIWTHCIANYRIYAFLYHYYPLGNILSKNRCKSNIIIFWGDDLDLVWNEFLNIVL